MLETNVPLVDHHNMVLVEDGVQLLPDFGIQDFPLLGGNGQLLTIPNKKRQYYL
jgi:hypothetical protein